VGLEVDLRLDPGARAPAFARGSLASFRPAVLEPLVERAELLVSEVVTNAIRHADLDPGDRIEIHMQGSPSMLRVDVIDPGRGFVPVGKRPGLHGGWGVWLLDRLATRWGVERDGNTRVWFEIRPAVSVCPGPGSD
jgi:anti-sigma regulatory factor (Ser/Thr protein kinase)